ncbi:MAG: sialidase family protein [bacterium]
MLIATQAMESRALAARQHGDGSPRPTVIHSAGGKRIKSAAAQIPYILTSRTGHEAGEPTLGLIDDGTIFYGSYTDSLNVDVLRSEDQGQSWQVVSPTLPTGQNRHVLTVDPYVYVDEATDRVFTVDLFGLACGYLSFSDNRGETWITNPIACGRPVNDHQTLFAGPPAISPTILYPNVVYYCFQDLFLAQCSKSLDGGLTFFSTGSPAFAPGPSCIDGAFHGAGVVGADGAVYLPKEHCDQPFLAVSHDEGATWTQVQVADNGAQQDPSVDVDTDGNVYYTWVGADLLPYLSVSRDGGSTWSDPLMIGAPGVLRSNLVTIDVGAPGRIAFLYMGTEDRKPPTTWNGYMGMSTSALRQRPIFYTAKANPETDPLKRGGCGPGRCGEEVLDFLDVVIAPDGTTWGSFVDACDKRCARSGIARGNEGIAGHLVGGPSLRKSARNALPARSPD